MLYGIDYASHQGWIDFAQLKREGHSFAISKATGENNYVNPYWQGNEAAARKAGLVVGTYDWVEPQTQMSGIQAAEDYWRVIQPRQDSDLVTVDFETPEWYEGHRGRDIETFMKDYLYRLKELAQRPIIVYTAPYFLQETGAVNWEWLGRDFIYWIAAPGAGMADDNAPWPGSLGKPWSNSVFHQHQWYAKSSAIGSGANFDRNRFNGTAADLRKLGKASSTSIPGGVTETLKSGLEYQLTTNPPTGKWTTWINDQGEPMLTINFGGKTKRIDGVNIQDVGISVESATSPGEIVDISVQDNVMHLWRERK